MIYKRLYKKSISSYSDYDVGVSLIKFAHLLIGKGSTDK